VPHRQSCRWSAFLSRSATGPCLWGRLFVWGRLSSLRPAFQPAWAPFTHCSLRHPMPRRVVADQRVRPRCTLWRKPPGLPCRMFAWSKPPGLPCRRSRRQSDPIPNATGVPTPSGPHDSALHLNPPPPVEQAARLAMPAVTPAERPNPERYGSPNAIRRQDWRRGPHDCALHLNPPRSAGADSVSAPSSPLRVLRVLCTTSP